MFQPLALFCFALLFSQGCVPKQMVQGKQAQALARVEAAPSPQPSPTPLYPQAKPFEENAPVTIQSRRLRYLAKSKETEFLGGVRVQQGSTLLSADRLITRSKGQEAKVEGRVMLTDTERRVLVTADEADYTNQLKIAHLHKHVHLETVDPYAQPVTLNAQEADYWAAEKRAALRGGVVLTRRDITATAGQAFYDGLRDLITLQQQAKVLRDPNAFWANQIQLFRKKNLIEMDGQVEARFVPNQIQQMAEEK